MEKLRNTSGKTAIDLAKHNGEIKISLVKIEHVVKEVVDKVKVSASRIDMINESLSTHREYHAKTSQILKKHGDDIKSIVTTVGNITIVKERRRKR